jgi:hypothetical protein
MEKRIVDIFRTQAIAENLHQLGLSPQLYARTLFLLFFSFLFFPYFLLSLVLTVASGFCADNERFRSTWDILSVNVDRRDEEFVSSMECKKYPFYATQFHPERNA